MRNELQEAVVVIVCHAQLSHRYARALRGGSIVAPLRHDLGKGSTVYMTRPARLRLGAKHRIASASLRLVKNAS